MTALRPSLFPPDRYVEDVLAGRRVVCKLVRLFVDRHLADLVDGHKRGLRFDVESGLHALEFFGFLSHSKGEWAGQPFVLSDWQAFRVWVLFGWLKQDPEKGWVRRFRVAYNEVARKNGKSTEGSGIGLYLFDADGEPGAEVYTFATKLEQARIIHREAVRMVRASPLLSHRIGIFKDNMHVDSTGSKFEPLGGDSKTLDGLNTHGGLGDEIHAMKDGDLYDVIETSTGARRQALLYLVTTAGWDRTSFCYGLHAHTLRVLEGTLVDDSWFGFIATLDDLENEWDQPDAWEKPNPNLGVSVYRSNLEEELVRAKESPARRNAFLRYRVNCWTQQATRWMNIEKWNACAGQVDLEALAGRPCWAGLDLSATEDLTSGVLAFPLEDGRVVLVPHFWIPEETAGKRSKLDRVPYVEWARDGFVTLTDGAIQDYDVIRRDLNELGERFQVREVGYDPWNAVDLGVKLTGDGFKMVKVKQNMTGMAGPTKAFEALYLDGRILHGDNPPLNWCAGNVAVVMNADGFYRPAKDKSTGRVDGIVAAIIAVGRMVANPVRRSVYDERGIQGG